MVIYSTNINKTKNHLSSYDLPLEKCLQTEELDSLAADFVPIPFPCLIMIYLRRNAYKLRNWTVWQLTSSPYPSPI